MEFTTVDGENTRLADVLRAQVYVENLQEVRFKLVYPIALGGCLVWIVATLPHALPAWVSRIAELAWPVLLGVFLLLLFLERRGKARILRLIKEGSSELENAVEAPRSSTSED